MPKIVASYDMFISSPGDVADEIDAIRKTVDKFNRAHRDSGTRILSARWDSDVFFPSGKQLQSAIDDMVASCDFLVAVFRTNIGTKTGRYPSGTAKEILTALKNGKQVFVYRLHPETPPNADDRSYRQLLDFVDTLHEKHVLVTSYKDCTELGIRFLEQLNLYYKDKLQEKETFYQAAQATHPLGVTHMQIENAPEDILREKIRTAKSVKILATSGRAFLALHCADLAEMLRRHGELKFLLPNPGSDFLEDVLQIEGRDPKTEPIHKEFDDAMGYLRRSLQLAGNHGSISIGCSYTLLRQTEIICIDSENRIWSWLTMTMPPFKASNESLSLGCQTADPQTQRPKTLAELANLHFDRLWELAAERKDIINFRDNKTPSYFYLERRTALNFWEEKLRGARNAVQQARKRYGDRCLIEIAAQHPLKTDGTPDAEFAGRLDMAVSLYHSYRHKEIDCRLYVPGSLHMQGGIADKVSLSAAGTTYLRQQGILENHIYGEAENKAYKGSAGVYNSADECFVAAQLWKDQRFGQMVCVCSPEQALRKAAHYIAFGVYPLIYTAPVWEPYHSYVEEMLCAVPDVLFRDPDYQSEKSPHAVRSRAERRPETNETTV